MEKEREKNGSWKKIPMLPAEQNDAESGNGEKEREKIRKTE